jgi:hypothetical protein
MTTQTPADLIASARSLLDDNRRTYAAARITDLAECDDCGSPRDDDQRLCPWCLRVEAQDAAGDERAE